MAQIRSDAQALKDEQTHLDVEIANAAGEAKAKLEARRNERRAHHAAQRARLQASATKLQESWDAKIASIKEKAGKAKAEARSRHQRHMENLGRFAAAQKAFLHDAFI